MIISLFFPLIFWKHPLTISGFFPRPPPPPRDVELSKENIVAPPPHPRKYKVQRVKLTLSHIN